MPSYILQWPITRDYWEREMHSRGTLYRELQLVPRGNGLPRRADAVVILDEADGRIVEKSVERDLDGNSIVVIQTEAAFLNAYVFGQARLSPVLVCQTSNPACMKAVLLCTSDLVELNDLIRAEFPWVRICIREGHMSGKAHRLDRLPGTAATFAAAQGAALIKPCSLLPKGLPLDGIIVDGQDQQPSPKRMLGPGLVEDKDVTIIHTEYDRGAARASNIGMWMAGEIIISQLILKKMGIRSVRSIILGIGRDAPIEAALKKYAAIQDLDLDVLEVRITDKGYRPPSICLSL